MRDAIKRAVHATTKLGPMEAALVLASERLWAWPNVQHAFLRFAPPPSRYGEDESRVVERHGAVWDLRPCSYFQWHHYFHKRDPVLDALLRCVRLGDRVLDVGANVGFYSVCLAKAVGPEGRVFAFEPNPASARLIAAHRSMNGVTNLEIVPVALGQEETRGCLLNPGQGDLGKFMVRSPEEGSDGETVEVRRLDSLVHELEGLDRVDLLKIDVEGFEPECLAGSRETVERHWPLILIESSPEWYEGRIGAFAEEMSFLAEGPYEWFELDLGGTSTFSPMPWIAELSVNDPQRNLLLWPRARGAFLPVARSSSG